MNLTICRAEKEDALTVAKLAIQMWEDNVLEELAAELAELDGSNTLVDLYCGTGTIGLNNLLDMLWAKFILCLNLLKLLAGIDKENIIVRLTALLHNEDTSRDTCAIEDICRQADNCIDVVLLLDEESTNLTLGSTSEQHSVRCDTSHCTTIVQVIEHMENKCVVRL